MVLMANDRILELLFCHVLMVNGDVLEVMYVLVITEKVLCCKVPFRTEGLLSSLLKCLRSSICPLRSSFSDRSSLEIFKDVLYRSLRSFRRLLLGRLCRSFRDFISH